MEFVAQLAERLIVVQVAVGSTPTKLPKLEYRIMVNISDSDSDDCGSNPYIPTIWEVAQLVEHLFIANVYRIMETNSSVYVEWAQSVIGSNPIFSANKKAYSKNTSSNRRNIA